jgi:hypothetical protein
MKDAADIDWNINPHISPINPVRKPVSVHRAKKHAQSPTAHLPKACCAHPQADKKEARSADQVAENFPHLFRRPQDLSCRK